MFVKFRGPFLKGYALKSTGLRFFFSIYFHFYGIVTLRFEFLFYRYQFGEFSFCSLEIMVKACGILCEILVDI
jgi:hypothetical protein